MRERNARYTREGDPHRHGTDRLQDAEDTIGLKEQAAVGQAVLFNITRRAGEQAALWRFQAHTQCGKDVRLEKEDTIVSSLRANVNLRASVSLLTPTQIRIIWMLLSIWGTPMRTFSKMGMSSEKLGTIPTRQKL
jgi:hypothetical protein